MKIFSKQLRVMATLLASLALFITASPASADGDLNRKIQQLVHDLSSFKQGEVLKGSETQVYISLGEKHGVVPGSRFEIIRQGDPLKIGDEIIGHEEKKVALAKIDRVRDKMSIGTLTTREEIPRAGDKAYEQRKPIKRIVIAQFSDNQGFNGLTKNLQDKLITVVIKRGLQVVERDQLEKVLAEQKMGYSGLVNIDTAKKVGKLLGADAMLLGTISDQGNNVSINARTVDMETGDSLSAAETELPKTPLIVQLRGVPVEATTIVSRSSPSNLGSSRRSSLSKGGRQKPTKSRPNSKATYQAGDVTLHVNSIVSKGKGEYQVLGRAVNNSEYDLWAFFMGPAMLMSQSGDYANATSSVGINICYYKSGGRRKFRNELRRCDDEYSESYVSLKPGLPRNFSIIYKGDGTNLGSQAELSFSIIILKEDKYKEHAVFLPDLPIQKKDDGK